MQVKLQWLIIGIEINGHKVLMLLLTKSNINSYTKLADEKEGGKPLYLETLP